MAGFPMVQLGSECAHRCCVTQWHRYGVADPLQQFGVVGSSAWVEYVVVGEALQSCSFGGVQCPSLSWVCEAAASVGHEPRGQGRCCFIGSQTPVHGGVGVGFIPMTWGSLRVGEVIDVMIEQVVDPSQIVRAAVCLTEHVVVLWRDFVVFYGPHEVQFLRRVIDAQCFSDGVDRNW